MRPSWDQTWLEVAFIMSRRSLCTRSQAGCVIVDNQNRVVGTGYNGPPRGMAVSGPCTGWCERAKTGGSLSYDDCVASHAEANALMSSDRRHREGGTAYVTRVPCFMCAKMLANSGVARVVMISDDPADVDRLPERTLDLFRTSRVIVTRVKWHAVTETHS